MSRRLHSFDASIACRPASNEAVYHRLEGELIVTATDTEPVFSEQQPNTTHGLCDNTRPLQQVVVALSFRLTDMGNGVDRIERATRISYEDALAGAEQDECEPLPVPTPPRLLDATVRALGVLGIKAPSQPELLIDGYSRLAASNAIDVVAWMALLL